MCKGSTADSDSVCLGSNPSSAAIGPDVLRGCFIEVWRSLVARFVRDEEVAGSNPVTSTTTQALKSVDSISLLRAFSFINHPKMTVSSLFSSLFMKISVVYLAADSSSRS